MAGVISVSVGSLESLSFSLNKIMNMVGQLKHEWETSIKTTINRINLKLDHFNSLTRNAYDKLQEAKRMMESAAQSQQGVSEYLYDEYQRTQRKYEYLKNKVREIERIRENYSVNSNEYLRSLFENVQNFDVITKKANAFLDKFTELIKRSKGVL